MGRLLIATMTVWVFGATFAMADTTTMTVTFRESAPKDSFEVRNTGNCQAIPITLHIDLGKSRGRLIFDVTGKGAGVEVFQPFEIMRGRQLAAATPLVRDGDDQLSLRLQRLQPADVFAFTIDVDDTLKDSALGQIRVAGFEIEGATATVATDGKRNTVQAIFSSDATAVLQRVPCA